jgi:2-C-methyl-D-erythritol 4-phosphate cytidylyltransferase
MVKVAVIVAGGGKGERFGSEENKIYAKIDNRPVFLRTLELFVNRQDVCQTILVAPKDEFATLKEKFGPNLGFMGVRLVEGGPQRVDSVAAGLAVVVEEAELVAVHDAVRPCVTAEMIDAVFAEAGKSGAAILAAPLHGTIKRVSGAGVIDQTIPREGLYEAQTPQVFRRALLQKAYAKRPADGASITDDAQLVELLNHPVTVVPCDASNLKITTKGDLALASAIIKSRPTKAAPRMGAFEEAQW